jgi:L-fucose mutarotase/ribose pyranase (RbsD/FucU family)
MRMISRLGAVGFGAIASLMTAAGLPAEENPNWRPQLSQELPLLGHRNWIVIADSAYPLQSASGIETVATGANQLAVLKTVLAQLKQSKHVRPVVYLDAELPFVSEDDAPGITAYRNELKAVFKDGTPMSLPHEEIIDKLDSSAEKFQVLILKTNMKLPYTSVFIELDCGYWSAEAEARMRGAMKQAVPMRKPGTSE